MASPSFNLNCFPYSTTNYRDQDGRANGPQQDDINARLLILQYGIISNGEVAFRATVFSLASRDAKRSRTLRTVLIFYGGIAIPFA